MDPRIEVFRLLHDGEITAIAGEQSETLTIFVSIPYLRRRLEPLGDSFVLTLRGVRRLEWLDVEGAVTLLRTELESTAPEILGTESESMPVTIATTTGTLIADYETIHVTLDTGETIAYDKLRQECEAYWTEWQRKADQGAPATAPRASRHGAPALVDAETVT